MKYRVNGENIIIEKVKNFSLSETLDCGQAFRWKEDGGKWSGIAGGRLVTLYETDGDIVIEKMTADEFESYWREYFDLDRDYGAIIDALGANETLSAAAQFASGIRILKQDAWEAVCSFIISSNNNIPRIKGIIDRLCAAFGDEIDGGYTFPTAHRLAALSVDDLAPVRSGFRAKYIIDAAQKVDNGSIDFDFLRTAPIEQARDMLMTIKGVGPKVADCALLFGCGRIECFPVDVWIKRAMHELFNDTLPDCALPYAGVAQQYIFHYARMTGLEF